MADPAARAFWDQRAEENALFFVDNELDYKSPSERAFWDRGEESLDRLLDAVGAELAPEDDVVEIGCGVGRMTHAIARRVRRVQALDVSPQMLEAARVHAEDLANVEWLLGDGASLDPIDDETVDVCLSFVVFQHIPDPGVTLGYVREIGRVLRPGGWAAFKVSNDPSVHRRPTAGDRLRIALRAVLRRGPRGQTDRHWLGSAVDLDELRASANDGLMEIERVTGEGSQFCLVLARRRSS